LADLGISLVHFQNSLQLNEHRETLENIRKKLVTIKHPNIYSNTITNGINYHLRLMKWMSLPLKTSSSKNSTTDWFYILLSEQGWSLRWLEVKEKTVVR
jgi:hypothetical protein